MKLQDLAKQIAAQLKLDVPIVRTVLLARGSPRAAGKTLAEAGVDRALRERIGNAARTLIHEELLRLDARAHPPAGKTARHRRGGPPRRLRKG